MAIPPSGVTEDKVHGQLCDRSTCQWNENSPVLLQNTVHHGLHAIELTFLVTEEKKHKTICGQSENVLKLAERRKTSGMRLSEIRRSFGFVCDGEHLKKKKKKQTLFWEKLKIIIVVAY